MSRTLPSFGYGERNGYDLNVITGWLESLIDAESERVGTGKAGKHIEARLDAAEDAARILNDVGEWTPSHTKRYCRKP